MPANLTPQYLEAERHFKEAQTHEEKMAALEEMMAIIPKHKGTEKLRAELKKKLSALRKDSSKKHSPTRRDPFHVERDGSRQLALMGAPNCGKSSLIGRLTKATPEVADYPYTTRAPIPGMLIYEGVHMQIVDIPPVSAEHMESGVPQVIRNADAILWVVDLSDDDLLDQIETTTAILEERKVDLKQRRVLMIANKDDAAGAADREAILREMYGSDFKIVSFSAIEAGPDRVHALCREVFEFLELIRVYTKAPGKKAERRDPFVLASGSTVLDLAGTIHRDLQKRLKFAKVWGEGKVDGLMAGPDFVLDDGDIVELHAA